MHPFGGLTENLADFCAMLRRDDGFHIGAGELLDAARTLEIVDLSDERWGKILAMEPPGITQAAVELADGSFVSGAVGDLEQLAGRVRDITAFGDFAAYLEAERGSAGGRGAP